MPTLTRREIDRLRGADPDEWTNGEKLACWLVGLGILFLALVVGVLETLFVRGE